MYDRDFPGSPVIKNLPANAGVTGSTSGPGTKIPHGLVQLSTCSATTDPTLSRAHVPQQEKPPQWAQAPQLEKAYPQQQRPSAAKNKSKK